jgi:hypothetical protein
MIYISMIGERSLPTALPLAERNRKNSACGMSRECLWNTAAPDWFSYNYALAT